MGNACVWRWGGDGWYKDWTEPPPPCPQGHTCALPVGNGAFVGQTVVTDCMQLGEG